MRNRLTSALVAGAVLAASPPGLAQTPPSAGFSVEALAGRGPPAGVLPGSSDDIRAALGRAQLVRAALSEDPRRAGQALHPMERRALQRALGRLDDPASAAMLAWFLRGATVRIGASGPGLVAGYYNPLADGWLVAGLTRIDGRWRIAEARLIDGAELRGAAGTWTAEPEPFLAMASGYRSSIAAFDRRFAGDPRGMSPLGDGLAPVARRTGQWIEALASWQRSGEALATAEAVRSAIAGGRLRQSGIGGEADAAQIDALPEAVRRSYAVSAAAARGDRISLFLISPLAPELLVLLDTDSGGAPAEIGLIDLSSLNEPGGQA